MSLSQEKRERRAYMRQVGHCRDRKIQLEFSFDEWRAWWLAKLGLRWMDLRGRTKGKYQMGRVGDVGPYSPENCICITVSKNSADGARQNFGQKNGLAKLTPEQIKDARRSYVPRSPTHGLRALSRKLGVSHGTLGSAVRGQTWQGEA